MAARCGAAILDSSEAPDPQALDYPVLKFIRRSYCTVSDVSADYSGPAITWAAIQNTLGKMSFHRMSEAMCPGYFAFGYSVQRRR